MTLRHAVSFAALLALGGCKLLDQTTFAPSPEAPVKHEAPPGAPVASFDKRVPLLSIGFGTPNPNYQDLLSYAVQQAESRRPDVAFDVVSVVPGTADSVPEALAAARGGDDAAQVMNELIAMGVSDTRIHLAIRTLPGLQERQVRVYIR
jgi:hypothetical protein